MTTLIQDVQLLLPMPALTISQPFASLIAGGEKFVENRTWATRYRGPVAIHAGSGTQYLTPKELQEYPTGCVIAVARLLACMPLAGMRQLSRRQRIPAAGSLTLGDVLDHEHTEGPQCWIFDAVRVLETPLKCPGQRGLWTLQKGGRQ